MISKNCLLGLIAETSIHAGAGSAVGVVDLPIQREGHNGWPCVFGSSMKGALRTHAYNLWDKDNKDKLLTLFGPERTHENDKTHAGALAISDARLLLLPVRSLTSNYRWVTCPEALERLQRDAQRLGVALPMDVPEIKNDEALVTRVQDEADEASKALFLEEYRFSTNTEFDSELDGIIIALAKLIERNDIVTELKKRLAIVSNDMFSTLVQSATPVNAHIAIEPERKTVIEGQLWYEETLPPETVMYVAVIAHPGRDNKKEQPSQVMDHFTELFPENKHWLQIGGNETVGMGWCAVKQVPQGAK
jgi:CRISPR-associated protein Cmr4